MWGRDRQGPGQGQGERRQEKQGEGQGDLARVTLSGYCRVCQWTARATGEGEGGGRGRRRRRKKRCDAEFRKREGDQRMPRRYKGVR